MHSGSDESQETASVNATLKELISLRGTKKGQLTKFNNFVTTLSDIPVQSVTSKQNKELIVRLNKIEGIIHEFDEIQTKIEVMTEEPKQLIERDSFEDLYYSSIALAQEVAESYSKANPDQNIDANSQPSYKSANTECNHMHNNIKLPTINLSTFDGNYLKWLEFRDTFDALINSNESISDINKFHYLRSSLVGSATVVIKSIEFIAQNYKVAWELLCARYDNKKILINNHLKALFALEPITRESHKAILFMIDHILKNLRSLETLGLPTDKWDVLIIYIMSTKLDSVTLSKWEEHKNNFTDYPSLNEFIKFIRNRADILETMFVNNNDKTNHKSFSSRKEINKSDSDNNQKKSFQQRISKSFVASANSKTKHNNNMDNRTCPYCNQRHRIVECSTFKDLSPQVRSSEAIKLNLCLNCLRRGHEVKDCRLDGNCRVCQQRHNSLLHVDQDNDNNQTILKSLSVSMPAQSSSQVLLGTAVVQVIDPKTKNTYLARALLDAGSQSSFITANLKNRMNLTTQNTSFSVTGINNAPVHLSNSCEVIIQSLIGPFVTHLKCLVMPKITGHLPNIPVDISRFILPANIKLADPNFSQPSEVDLLLGAEVFFDAMSPNKLKMGPGMPILQDTQFGWIVAGPLNISPGSLNKSDIKHTVCNFTKEINNNLIKFWNIEEVSTSKLPSSPHDEFCEQHFVDNTTRLENGRFSVKMPLLENPETALGESYYMAEKRLLNIEKKLMKNSSLREQYHNFIKEYEDLGHLTKIDRPPFGYFIPHHAVIRESSETTKLRVVFDASAKTTSKKSLNDIQAIGPTVQDELFDILIRFRQHKYVISGDITKMYRQVMLDKSQRNLQLILWRDDDSRPINILQLNTVTYGTAAAPFLSTRCLKQLADDCTDPMISEVIKHDFYYDDLLTGCSNQNDLLHIHKGVTHTLASACFPIHKFRTNCPQIFTSLTENTNSLDLDKESNVLGVLWAPNTDSLKFSINLNTDTQTLTKRNILSNTCRIFDPLGLLSACTITLKVLLQKLWKLKLEWDDPVPHDIKRLWEKVISHLNLFLTVSVPRYAMCSSPVKTELHCFVDASQDAYAACVYIRSLDADDVITIRLLCSKTRVAPLKPVTIPRLELCAALLGARLMNKVSNALRCKINNKYFWSDSTITLGWIKTQPKLLKAFVCNRINEIHELTERNSWRYVPTDLNPADLASRGVAPNVLIDSALWWEGPSFLLNAPSEWPTHPNIKVDLPEIKVHITQETHKFINFDNYSSATRLKRVYAYVFRFISNCKTSIKNKSPLTKVELQNSLNFLIKMAQRECFSHEIDTLSKGKSLKPKSHILSLSPFIDDIGVLRVGGRLKNAAIQYEKKHPALLDSKHNFTKILMTADHLRLGHAGPQLLLCSFREQFWPIGGRTLARSIVRKCIICKRFKAKTLNPYFGDLPTNRVTEFYPFQICGTDFAGPFMISSKKGRGNRVSKSYLCIFICFASKAVHLETVSDLSTAAFIACLKRFISRRGKPSNIYCDNAKNFVGARNELGRMLRSSLRSVHDFTSNEGINFVFNPPYSPTFGGLWEAGVKSAKHHLKRIAGNSSLTFEELSTLFTQIEAILNSRPLTPLSPDPNDLSPLTPGHFLIGRPLTSLPAPSGEIKNPKNRYTLIENLRQQFWTRWRQEYLAELQQRTKCRLHQQNLQIGDLVVFKEEGLPPLKWKMGRVQKVYPGSDGIVRVADFKTYRGTERRAVNKVCPLTNQEEEAE